MNGKMSAKEGRARLWLIAILGAGLVIRIVYLVQLSGSDVGQILSLDARFYDGLAESISSGKSLPGGALLFNPFYPAFLVTLYRLFGPGLLAPRIVQSILGLATVLLLYIAGKRIGAPRRGEGGPTGETIGLIAAALAVLYPQFILYEGNLLATSIVTFLMAAAFALAVAVDQDLSSLEKIMLASRRVPPWLSSVTLGLLLGAGSLGRPNLFLILVPLVPLWLFVRHRAKRGGRVSAVVCLAGSALVLSVPILYNASRTGQFVPVTAHGGINFYIGNRSGAGPTYSPPEGMRTDIGGLVEYAEKTAEARTGESLTASEISNFWFRETFGEITDDPPRWLRLEAKKLLLFWNGLEVPDVFDISFYRGSCGVLKFLVIPFAVLSPLALLGLAVLLRGGRNRSVFLIFVGASLASVMLFFVVSRYRIPAVPVLILLGALFVGWMIDEIGARRWRSVTIAVLLFAAITFFISARSFVGINRSAGHTFLGNYYMELGEMLLAEEAYSKAHRLDPGRVQTNINYARILSKLGQKNRALELYEKAYALQPDFPLLALEYGAVLESLGRREEARERYRFALTVTRAHDMVLACKFLSRLSFAEGDRDEAIYWIRRGLEINPSDRSLVETLRKLEGSQQ